MHREELIKFQGHGVIVQGHMCTLRECYDGGGIHSDGVTSRRTSLFLFKFSSTGAHKTSFVMSWIDR